MTGFGFERPEADVVEQRVEERAPTDDELLEPIEELPAEADESDVVEQHRVVPLDDEERAGG